MVIKDEKKLESIKSKVTDSFDYFRPNYERYKDYRTLVFKDSRDSAAQMASTEFQRPNLEMNIMNAFVMKQLGRYISQSPSVRVSANNNPQYAQQIKVVEGHLRSILSDANKDLVRCYRDSLAGGFSVLQVLTEYENPLSMNQVIKLKPAYDPTLCYFDKRATALHKGDGQFCGMAFPMSVEEFKKTYRSKMSAENLHANTNTNNYSYPNGSSFDKFKWSYTTGKTNYIIICEHYEKIYRNEILYQIRFQDQPITILKRDYDRLIKNAPIDMDPDFYPDILDQRETLIYDIERTILTNRQILKKEKTSFTELPLIFTSGDTLLLHKTDGAVEEMARPYIYSLLDWQRMKNLSMTSTANDMENMNQNLLMVSEEALPSESTYQKAFEEPQSARVLVYKEKDDEGRQNQGIPMLVPRQQTPSYVQQILYDNVTPQSLLGSYQHQLAQNPDQLSGKAIFNGAAEGDDTSLPYFYNFVESALGRFCQIAVEMIPLYYQTARTIPIKTADGERKFVQINQQGGVKLDYSQHSLNVEIKPGMSNSMQKQEAFNTMISLMKVSPVIGEFLSTTPQGLKFLLSNVESKGIEELMASIDPFVQQWQQQKQLQQQQQKQQLQEGEKRLRAEDPTLLKQQELQLKNKQLDQEAFYQGAKMANENHNTDVKEMDAITKRMKVELEAGEAQSQIEEEKKRLEAEEERSRSSAMDALSNLLT